MSHLKFVIVAPRGGVGSSTFLDSLPFPRVKVPNPHISTGSIHYYALPSGDMLEVRESSLSSPETDAYLVMWRNSVSGSEVSARATYERITQKKVLMENLDGTVGASQDSVAFSFRDSQECARVVMEMVAKVRAAK